MMDLDSAEDILNDSIAVFEEEGESERVDTSRITYGPLVITVAPKVCSFGFMSSSTRAVFLMDNPRVGGQGEFKHISLAISLLLSCEGIMRPIRSWQITYSRLPSSLQSVWNWGGYLYIIDQVGWPLYPGFVS